MPGCWLLVPGFGAQGATAADVAGALDSRGLGAVINSSRAITFAYRDRPFEGEPDWERAIDKACRLAIDQLRSDTPAGRLV
jgi:orotidine-5'-phosphate decarboxylase